MLFPQQGIAEGEPGGNAVFFCKSQGFLRSVFPKAHPAPAPKAVRRGSVDGADIAPVVKVFPVLPVQRKEDPVQVQKFKEPGKMVMGSQNGRSPLLSGTIIAQKEGFVNPKTVDEFIQKKTDVKTGPKTQHGMAPGETRGQRFVICLF